MFSKLTYTRITILMLSIVIFVMPTIYKIALITALSTAFWVWQFIECYKQEPLSKTKIVWLLLIALTHVIGAASYFFYSLSKQQHK